MKTQPAVSNQNRHLITAGLLCMAVALLLLLAALAANGQDAAGAPVAPPDAPAQVTGGLTETIIAWANQYPAFAAFLIALGSLRLVIKPLMAGLRLMAANTKTTRDDEILDRMERSWVYTAFLFVLDWLTSIKVKANASAEPPKGGTPSGRGLKLILFILLPSAFILTCSGCVQIGGERVLADGSRLSIHSNRFLWSSEEVAFTTTDTSGIKVGLKVGTSRPDVEAINALANIAERAAAKSAAP